MPEHPEHPRRRLPGGLPGVGGFVADRANDAVHLLRFLPDIVVVLKSIDAHVSNMDREVHLMREGVDRLDAQVQLMRGDITNLSADLEAVAERIGRLEPHISDLSRLARPLKRMRSRTSASASPEPRPADVPQLPSGEEAPPDISGLA